jgi:hypothetical protein
VTQVVLPSEVLVRRRDEVAVVGAAWESYARGTGTKRTAEELGLPAETVRGWLRRLRHLVRTLAMAHRGADDRGRSRLGLALIAATARAEGWDADADLWRFAAYRSQGRLLLCNTSWPFEQPSYRPMG